MDIQKFMERLRSKAQANLEFLRSEGMTGDHLDWRAANTALDSFAVEVSIQDFYQMIVEVGAERDHNVLVEKIAAELK